MTLVVGPTSVLVQCLLILGANAAVNRAMGYTSESQVERWNGGALHRSEVQVDSAGKIWPQLAKDSGYDDSYDDYCYGTDGRPSYDYYSALGSDEYTSINDTYADSYDSSDDSSLGAYEYADSADGYADSHDTSDDSALGSDEYASIYDTYADSYDSSDDSSLGAYEYADSGDGYADSHDTSDDSALGSDEYASIYDSYADSYDSSDDYSLGPYEYADSSDGYADSYDLLGSDEHADISEAFSDSNVSSNDSARASPSGVMHCTRYWDCGGQTCDCSKEAGGCKAGITSPKYQPVDPSEHGGPAMGEKIWLTGAASDSLSELLGANDPCCGKTKEGGCGKCVYLRNPDSKNPQWGAIVMKKMRCPPASAHCDKPNFDLALPGFDNLKYSLANKCGEPGTIFENKVDSEAMAHSKPGDVEGCSKLPKVFQAGCKLFQTWGWNSGMAANMEWKVVDCPAAMKKVYARNE